MSSDHKHLTRVPEPTRSGATPVVQTLQILRRGALLGATGLNKSRPVPNETLERSPL
jgi:hypothetical protein